MPIKLANNASGTLATAINASDTGIALTTGDGVEFPTLGAGDYFYATITSTQGTQEIVKATARSGDSLTVVRAQEGTSAAGFAVGSRFELRVTAQSVFDAVGDVVASQVGFTPTGGVAATDVQAAIAELDTEKVAFTRLDDNDGASLVGFLQSGVGATARTVQSKERDVINVKDFGAVGDGVADDAAAFQLALNAAAALGNAFLWLAPADTYKCGSGLTIDTNKVGIIGNGARLSFATLSSGSALTITQSNADGNLRNALNHAHPISGVVFVGPGVAVAGVTCITIRDSSSPNIISGGIVRDCAFINFANDVVFGSGAFCWTFDKCNFTLTSGTPSTYSITIPNETNSGERNSFNNCMWNNRPLILDQSEPDTSTFFNNCSFDYGARMMTISAGSVFVIGGHVEHSVDTDYWFNVSGTNTLLSFLGVSFHSQASKTNFSPFYSDSTCITGGVSISGGNWNQLGSISVPLIGGTGRTSVEGVTMLASASIPTISVYQNDLAYGGFESANYTAEFTLANGAIRSNTTARTGTWSLSFPASSGVTPSAFCTFPCTPGQKVCGEYWYRVPAITGTGGTFYTQVDYLDKGGNVISNVYGVALTTVNVANWTRISFQFPPAPAGTVGVKLFWDVFGTTSGTPIAYVDDVIGTAV